MTFRIKLAQTTAELDALFHLRHKVFVEEKKYMPPSYNGRLSDCFDSFPTTGNIVALVDGKVVGGLRFVEPSAAGTPADTFFDFGPYLPADAEKVGSGSMLLVDPEYRAVPHLTSAMLGMGHYWAIDRGLTHITGISAPAAEKLFIGCGYQPVVPRFFHQQTQLYAMPVILNVRNLNARLRSFIDEQSNHSFEETFDRQFHSPGEVVLSTEEAETGRAYRILNGSVALTVEEDMQTTSGVCQRPARKTLVVLQAGASFSQHTLQSLRIKGVRAIALTELDLMVMEQDELYTSMMKVSQQALKLSAGVLSQTMRRSDGLMSNAA